MHTYTRNKRGDGRSTHLLARFEVGGVHTAILEQPTVKKALNQPVLEFLHFPTNSEKKASARREQQQMRTTTRMYACMHCRIQKDRC